MRAMIFLIAALLLPAASWALYSKGDAVVQLTAANFESVVVKSDGVAMVEFYAPWCGHCKNLAPNYKIVAQKLKGIVTVGAVDCDDNANKKLCAQFGIQGFPTIKLFGPDRMKNPYTHEFYKEPTDYKGGHTSKNVMDAATGMLSTAHITRIASIDEFETFTLNRPEIAKVMLFTSKKETPLMFKGISMQLHRGLDFAEVHSDVEDVVVMHEVTDFPTVIVAKPDGTQETYSGDLKATQLLEFLTTFSSAPPEKPKEAGGSGSESDKKKAAPTKAVEIKNLTLEEAIELDSQEDMWLLGLYSPGEGAECAESVSSFTKAVTEMQEVVKVALVAVPQDKADEVARYGASAKKVRSDPCTLQLVLLPFGEDKADSEDYSLYSGALEGKALQKWVTDAVPSGFASEVTPHSLQYFLSNQDGPKQQQGGLQAYAKVILFTNKDEVPGVYKALSANFRSKLGFGWVQSSAKSNKDMMRQFNIDKVPALQFIIFSPATQGENVVMQPQAFMYRGALKYTGMAQWLETMAGALVSAKDAQDPESEEVVQKMMPEVTDDEGLKEHCTGKGGICIIALLDPSSEKFADKKKSLVEMAIKIEGQPFHFCWIDGKKYRPVSVAFGLMASDLPSVVALSAKRMRYATLPATDVVSIATFMDGVLGGKVKTEVLQELPKVVEGAAGAEEPSAAAAAAAEEAMEPVEEEFDLSDILSEEVESSQGDRLKQVEEELKAEEEARKAAESAKKAPKKKSKKSKKSKGKAKSEL